MPKSETKDGLVLGAEYLSDGVRYAVWAPEKSDVQVHIRGTKEIPKRVLSLEKGEQGYFTAHDVDGRPGDTYSFTVDNRADLPDLASRYQPEGISGPSMVIDSSTYGWQVKDWRRPAWKGQVIYELHVGTWTPEGTFRSAIARLDHLVELGVSTVELMPVAQCSGRRNWGYDGVFLFAPYHAYGTPDDMRALIDACHARGLAVLLDVVYNHIGAIGDFTSDFSKFYSLPEDSGKWGKCFNLDGENCGPVRQLILQNVRYWLDEFRIDGYRFDAVDHIRDSSKIHLIAEAAQIIHQRGGVATAEDNRNWAGIYEPATSDGWDVDAAWADDFHHTARVSHTHETQGYYCRYTGSTQEIADTLRHGWLYRGQRPPDAQSPRGTECAHIQPAAFIHCISNHDQVGNRAYGERLNHSISPAAYRALSLLFCLTPYTPLLFMGQEWAASSPFLFFSDHPGDFGRLTSEGRKREFQHQEQSGKPLLDCQAETTFRDSQLRWAELNRSSHREIFHLYREGLRIRKQFFAEENPGRQNWTVEALPSIVAITYQWPGRSLEVRCRISPEEESAPHS